MNYRTEDIFFLKYYEMTDECCKKLHLHVLGFLTALLANFYIHPRHGLVNNLLTLDNLILQHSLPTDISEITTLPQKTEFVTSLTCFNSHLRQCKLQYGGIVFWRRFAELNNGMG